MWEKKHQKKEGVIEHAVFISLRYITDKNFPSKFLIKHWQFIYHVFAPFVKLQGYRFLYFFDLCHVRKEAVFLILEYFSLRGVKQKTHKISAF